MKKKLTVFILLFTFCNFPVFAGIDELQNGFQNPTDDARIMMRWWWFGSTVTKSQIEKELRAMRDGGIGGVEVQPVYPLLPDDEKFGIKNLPFLSDEFLEMLKFTAQKTKELNMRLDLTLGSGWSFGGPTVPLSEGAGQIRFVRTKVNHGLRRIPLPSMIYAENLHGVFLAKVDGDNIVSGSLQTLTDIRDGSVSFRKTQTAARFYFLSAENPECRLNARLLAGKVMF